jgi:hypothetical protein
VLALTQKTLELALNFTLSLYVLHNTYVAVGLEVSKIMTQTTRHCGECGKSENVVLQELFGSYFCTGCLAVAMNGGKPAIKEARQLRLDESISTSDAPIPKDEIQLHWPGEQRASRARQAISFEEERVKARQRMLEKLDAFHSVHPWIKPGMVVVNIATGDIAVIRASTNPDIKWTQVYLTTDYVLREGTNKHKPVVPASPVLRIADPSEYEEARQLLSQWPKKARSGIYIDEPGDAEQQLFDEQYMALLQEVYDA